MNKKNSDTARQICGFLEAELGPAMPDKDWLFRLKSAKEAARELGTSVHHLANLRCCGRGCGYVLDGRRVKYPNYHILYHQLTSMKNVFPGEGYKHNPSKRGRPRKQVLRKRAIRKSTISKQRDDAGEVSCSADA